MRFGAVVHGALRSYLFENTIFFKKNEFHVNILEGEFVFIV